MIDPVTSRYANALFSLAMGRGVLDAVSADVERLAREVGAPGVGDFYFDARVSIDARRLKIASVTQSMHELTKNFVNLLFDKRREEVLRNLSAAFHQRALDERGAAEGIVESARALGAGEIASLATAFGAELGKRVTLENKVTDDVLGGVRVIVGSQMIDRSLRGRLDGLKKKLGTAALPSLSEQ